jgi:hypothetical protein
MRSNARLWLAGIVVLALGVGSMIAAEPSSASMATAATKLLAALTPEQRAQATFAFTNTDERLHWHFIPTEMFPRKGLLARDMTGPQRELARGLLKAGLSQRGYLTATQIMDLETILRGIEEAERAARGGRGNALERDPGKYFFSIFGTPSTKETWGWRVEGHHVSLNFTIVNGTLVAASPSFFGSNPAEVRVDGPKKGTRILAAEEDSARALLSALDASQRTKAIINVDAPGDMLTMATVEIKPLSPIGITADALNPAQRDLLMKLIDVYTGFMADDIAADRVARFKKAGIEKIAFAWAGPMERGAKHYYRIQGPTFLVEYDNTQNDGNHVHSVWRDFDGDFGRDLLREHLKSVAH